MTTKISHHTIEPSEDGYWLVAHGEYGEDSVLAGQDYRALIWHYEDLEVAKREHPEAEVLCHSTKDPFAHLSNQLPDAPPSWFDPLDAGEVWHEDDY